MPYKNKSLKCPECRPLIKTFAEKRGLQFHIMKNHPHLDAKKVTKNLTDVCPFCEKQIKSVHEHKKKCLLNPNPPKGTKSHPTKKPSKMEKKETENELVKAKNVEKAKIVEICRQYVDLEISKTKEQENTTSREPEYDMEGESENVNMAEEDEQENTSSVTPENEMQGESANSDMAEGNEQENTGSIREPENDMEGNSDAVYEALMNHVTNMSEKVDFIENNLREVKKLLSECKHFLSTIHETR